MPKWLGEGIRSHSELKAQIAEHVKPDDDLYHYEGLTSDRANIEVGHENSKKGW